MSERVLVIEDEEIIREVIVINLTRAGFDVFEAGSGEDGLDRFSSVKPGIVLLDINLPGIDGFEVCRRIRERSASVGIIMLTARSQETDRIGGLKSGADDYVTKPFSPAELVARVEALGRRIMLSGGNEPKEEGEVLRSGPFELNTHTRVLTKNGEEKDITQVEYLILCYMMKNEGKILSRRDIYDHVWAQNENDLKIVDVNMRRLRVKIERDPSAPEHIQTVWGTGYMWRGSMTR